MNDKQALEIFESCIDEMYKNSTPPTTWREVKQKYRNTDTRFYHRHSLSEQDYNRIKDKYAKKLPLFYKHKLDWFLLDYAPCLKKEEKE